MTGWRDRLHSRLVAWMKIVLPLAALALLSTLFMISNRVDPSRSLPPVGIDLRQRAQALGATGAVFAGVTREGHEVQMRTQTARPDPEAPQLLLARNISARFRLVSGTEVRLRAEAGTLDQRRSAATLTDAVRITTSSGYELTSERLTARFDTLHVESPGPVAGKAPAGELSAGRMVLSAPAAGQAPHLLFSNGVKLIYRPGQPGD